MKLKNTSLKFFCWLFILIITFESCAVYHRTPISLLEASQIDKKVQVTTSNNRKIELNRIEKENDVYYGYKHIKRVETKIPLNEKDIVKVRKKDSAASTFLNIGICVTGIGIVVLALYLSADTGWTDPAPE